MTALRYALAREAGAPRPEADDTPPAAHLGDALLRHCVTPVLAPWGGEIGMDDGDLALLAEHQRRLTERALHNAAWLATLCAALDTAGVRVLVLKGLPLSFATTGTINGRHVGDIDLLVHPDDLSVAQQTLGEVGMSPVPGTMSPSEGRHHRWVRYVDHHRNFSAPGRPLVELHWRTSRTALIELGFDELWEWRSARDLGGVTINSPGSAHSLLHVSVHAALHQFARMQWAVDTARLHRDAPPSVRAVAASRAAELGAGQAFAMGEVMAGVLVERVRSRAVTRPLGTAVVLTDHCCRRALERSSTMALQYTYKLATLQGVATRSHLMGNLLLPSNRLAEVPADRARSIPAALAWRTRDWIRRNVS